MPTLDQLLTQYQPQSIAQGQWQPDLCPSIALRIDATGQWWQDHTPITRFNLIKLFASVLRVEEQHYYLVTPIEKVPVQVADAAFVLTRLQWLHSSDSGPVLLLQGDFCQALVCQQQPIIFELNASLNCQVPYLTLRTGIRCQLSRSLYYQLVDLALAQQHPANSEQQLILTSANHAMLLS